MRDNEERLTGFSASDVSAASQMHQSSQTDGANLNFSSPTEFVELPSKGQFYHVGHPLHGKDTVEIRFMTAKEEDILTSKALIKKGVAIDRMLQNLLVDKTLKVEDLLVGDKNALIVAARVSGYGSDYEVSVTCPACEAKSKHTFDLEALENKQLEDLSEIGVSKTENGTFICNLYKTGATVEFRLLYGKDEIAMLNEANMKKSSQLEQNSTSQLKRVIVSVNGILDRGAISKFVDSMPSIDSRHLRSLVKRINPEVEMKQEFTCSSCGHEEEVEVPFTVEFFWPK